MKSRSLILILSLMATAVAPVLAEPPRRELPPEEKREIRQQMREHWYRENTGAQRPDDARPANWRDLPPEERRRLREEMREQHDRDDRRDKRRPRKDD